MLCEGEDRRRLHSRVCAHTTQQHTAALPHTRNYTNKHALRHHTAPQAHLGREQDAAVLGHAEAALALQQRPLLRRREHARRQLRRRQQGVVGADLAVLLAVEDVDLMR